jgi:hypothetical protein
VQDNDFLDDAYFASAIDAVKLQIKKAGVRLAMLIDAAAAGTLPANLLKLTRWSTALARAKVGS